MQRTSQLYAIGDVHGCIGHLRRLIEEVLPLEPGDRLVFLGDYVDRGPHSAQVIDYLLDLREQRDCIFLRGNHDDWFLRALRMGTPPPQWLTEGGRATMTSYEQTYGGVPATHRQFLEETVLHHREDPFFFVHAGALAETSIEDALQRGSWPRTAMWDRSHWVVPHALLHWEAVVVCGHTVTSEPIDEPKRIGLDTGAYQRTLGQSTGALTAVRLPDRTFFSVQHPGPLYAQPLPKPPSVRSVGLNLPPW